MKFSTETVSGQLAMLGALQLFFGNALAMTLNGPRQVAARALSQPASNNVFVERDIIDIIEATAGTIEELADELSLDLLCLIEANPFKAILSPGELISIPISCCGSSCKGPFCSQRQGCNGKTSTTAPPVTSSTAVSVSITNTASPTSTPLTLTTSTVSVPSSTTSTALTSTSSTASTPTTSSSSTTSSTISAAPTTTTSSSFTTSPSPTTSSTPSSTPSTTPPTTAPSTTSTTAPTSSSIVITSVGPTTGDLTVTFTNAQTAAASVSYASNSGAPPANGNPAPTGVIPAGGSTVVTLPTGWAGNLVIGNSFNTNGSLFEASFNDPVGNPAVAYDVSYVNGFSVPVVCGCGGVIASGCNIDLFSKASCPNLSDDKSVCLNPARLANDGPPTAFFAPCKGAAFTYPDDTNANTNCASHSITCCIGSACPADPKQPSS